MTAAALLAAAAVLAAQPLLTEQSLSPELDKLIKRAHAHHAVGSLEAAGCELALVMTSRDYSREGRIGRRPGLRVVALTSAR